MVAETRQNQEVKMFLFCGVRAKNVVLSFNEHHLRSESTAKAWIISRRDNFQPRSFNCNVSSC